MDATQSRRAFLESLGVSAATLALAGYAERPAFAANDTLGVGVIGCGGRARGMLMPVIKKVPGLKFVAVCDVYDEHLKSGHFVAGGGDVFQTKDHHELLARKDVDAVIIASPDHLHVPLTIDACNAGKDVYCEKPVTHTVEEGQSLVDAQDKNKRMVQVGTQQRSMPHFMQAKKWIEEGKLGKVHKVRMTWNRNFMPFRKAEYRIKPEQVDWKKFLGAAPDQPFDAYRMREWRWMWDFGGGIFTDLMVHWYDAASWMLGLNLPSTVTSIGDHFAVKGAWETPDTVNTIFQFSDKQLQCQFDGTFCGSRDRAHLEFVGEEASLYLDRGRIELIPEPNRGGQKIEEVLGKGERGLDFYDQPEGETLHISSWAEAIRTRSKPSCPAEEGVKSAAVAHLCNRAYRTGKVVKIGPGE
jgi:predicted dehydrogenase